ncbi:hypothetical protein SUGI_1073280 [Cryptomeria japonica]|uniref:uncharacterized protein LOC131027749 n=1 Tax=Cryptomeria japonica TaxID=3369 RepID=UPI002414A4CC|nr:uncharacterized protein LOC131027749 [Cryptomeria japonica]GLJ50369.1 hypothetical protein SUGI_1073280 [Cryptomeria japonica]
MGNPLWCIFPITAGKNMKIIRLLDSNGRERRLQELQITANEIMKRYPENIVAQADSFYIGEKVPVLSADEKLEAGQSYFLLPETMKGSVLSASWLASLAGKASRVSPVSSRFPSAISVQPFEAEKTEDGRIQLKIMPEFIQKLLENGKMGSQSDGGDGDGDGDGDDDDSCSGLCSTPELQKDYQQLVRGRAHAWRPRLETIVEEHKGYKLFRLRRKN